MKSFVIAGAMMLVLAVFVAADSSPFNYGWQSHVGKMDNNPVRAGEMLKVGQKCLYKEQPWGYNVWGVGGAKVVKLPNGTYVKEVVCFVPGESKHKQTVVVPTPAPAPAPLPEPEPVCHMEQVCEQECSWECSRWGWGRWCWDWDYVCEDICHEVEVCDESVN